MDRFKGKTAGSSPFTTETPMEHSIALVTGATSGLGYAAARALAGEGWNEIIVTGRSLGRAQETAAQLAAETKIQVFTPLELDLDTPSSVQSALADLVKRGRPVDFLLLNAGVIPGKKRVLTAAGIEAAQAPLIGHHQLTVGLLRANLLRTPAEFRERHVEGSILHPITDLAPQTVKELAKGKTACVVICASGHRASMAATKLRNSGLDAVYVLEGGVQAWVAAGFPIVRGKATMSLERQVRVAAGTLVAAGCLMAYFISLTWLILPGFVGCGLVFAGITDTCSLGMLLPVCTGTNRSIL